MVDEKKDEKKEAPKYGAIRYGDGNTYGGKAKPAPKDEKQ